MDIFNLILLCSVVSSSPHQTLLYQITQTAEQSPRYVDDLTAADVYDPSQRREAAQITRALMQAGHDLRVGLTQVPAHLARRRYQATPRTLVRACTNISYGSQRLHRARARHPDDKVHTLAFYYAGSADDPLGQAWAHHVLEARSVNVEHAARHPAEAPPSPQYPRPDSQLFVLDPQLTSDEEITPRRARTMFSGQSDSRAESSANDGGLPPISKFPPPDSDDSGSARSDDASSESRRPARQILSAPSDKRSFRKRADTSGRRQQPQPPVTDETLPTSNRTDPSPDAGGSPEDESPADNSRSADTPDAGSRKEFR